MSETMFAQKDEPLKVDQRVRATDPDTGKQRNATVIEVDERTACARVCFDLKWMHDWLPLAKLSPIPDERTPLLSIAPSDELGDLLAPELEDPFEYIEATDYVRVVPYYAGVATKAERFGTVKRVNVQAQYALVQLDGSSFREWFSVDEVFLVFKGKSALKADSFLTVLSA